MLCSDNKTKLREGFLRPVRLLGALALTCATSVAGAGVGYSVIDLPDISAGQDLWRYHYLVEGPLPAFGAFNLVFPHGDYGELVLGASSAGLGALLAQPDAGLGWDGLLTLTALAALLAGSTESVDLDFIWQGVGLPADQDYEILDDTFSLIGSARTQLAVTQPLPAPAALGLSTFGLLALPLMLRRRRRAALP